MKNLANRLKQRVKESKVLYTALASMYLTHFLGDCVISGIKSHAKAREQRIVQFYQQNGACPSDATPAYLDLRTQLWQRDVESKS